MSVGDDYLVIKNAVCHMASLQCHCENRCIFTGVPVVLFVPNAIVTVLGPYCSQLPLAPVQCAVSFIIYSGPIWSDKPSPSSEAITNNNDDKTQRIFALF